MPPLDHHLLSFIIRWIHTGSMAFMLGGSLLVWGLMWRSRVQSESGLRSGLLFVAQRYELWFWIALGVQVVTGIGNLGAFGANLPAPDSAWGVKLMLKLSLVLLFMLWSLPRSLFVARADAMTKDVPLIPKLQWLYGGTVVFLAAILVLAVALAHG